MRQNSSNGNKQKSIKAIRYEDEWWHFGLSDWLVKTLMDQCVLKDETGSTKIYSLKKIQEDLRCNSTHGHIVALIVTQHDKREPGQDDWWLTDWLSRILAQCYLSYWSVFADIQTVSSGYRYIYKVHHYVCAIHTSSVHSSLNILLR